MVFVGPELVILGCDPGAKTAVELEGMLLPEAVVGGAGGAVLGAECPVDVDVWPVALEVVVLELLLEEPGS